MDTSNRNKKLLATILNKTLDLYSIRKNHKYFTQSNFIIEDVLSKHIIFFDGTNKYSGLIYYHYYICLSIMPDLTEVPDLLEE
jgi:hypothetical protein|nr:MAG TPA: hypothetical protein [Caudoviricetes sp.]